MHKVCIITIYFGKLPGYFNLWLASCGKNRAFEFLLITDQEVEDAPANVKVVKSTLTAIKQRFESILGIATALEMPYKLCDYRPLYGAVFQDIICEYDFWGHCDIDLIWGDLEKFITERNLNDYDKIFPLGHLSLYRNTPRINTAYRLGGSRRGDWRYVVSNNKSCVFDERYGINKIFEENNLPIDLRETAADIGFRNRRMIIAGSQNKNYAHQLFTYERGHCYRYYVENGRVSRDEFSYIHLQKRPYANTLDSDNFIVGQDRFIPLIGEVTIDLIKKYNPYNGRLCEWVEYHYKDLSFRIHRRLKQLFVK